MTGCFKRNKEVSRSVQGYSEACSRGLSGFLGYSGSRVFQRISRVFYENLGAFLGFQAFQGNSRDFRGFSSVFKGFQKFPSGL